MTNAHMDDWEKHWEDYTDSASFNPAQAYRRQLIIHQLKKIYKSSSKILDIGSGQGDLIADLSCVFPTTQLYGVELSQKGVEISQKKIPSAHFFKMDLLSENEIIPAPLKLGIDIAICSEVLEHLDTPTIFLNNVTKLLKDGATLIFTVPSGPRSAYDRHIGHRKHYSINELKNLLEQSGYRVNSIFRAGFPFFNLYKMVVILRGKKLIEDNRRKKISYLAKYLMQCFSFLFKSNLTCTPWGWQLIAVAEYKMDLEKSKNK